MGNSLQEFQTTLRTRVSLSGAGVHGGKPVSIHFSPADPDTGIVFSRIDDSSQREIRALVSEIGATDLCTVLGDPAGLHVATVEHLMAALSGLGIDNVSIEIDGPEVPILDGSAAAFVDAFEQAGIEQQDVRRRYIRVVRPVRIDSGASWAEFLPYDGTRFEVGIEFDSPAIGRQSYAADMNAARFAKDIARARTFGFMQDVEAMRSQGLALGGSMENAIVMDEYRVLNADGLRYGDEFVKHKVLDAVGDLYLLGHPLLGAFSAHKSGHALNNRLLRALLADKTAWEMVSFERIEEAPASVARLFTQPA